MRRLRLQEEGVHQVEGCAARKPLEGREGRTHDLGMATEQGGQGVTQIQGRRGSGGRGESRDVCEHVHRAAGDGEPAHARRVQEGPRAAGRTGGLCHDGSDPDAAIVTAGGSTRGGAREAWRQGWSIGSKKGEGQVARRSSHARRADAGRPSGEGPARGHDNAVDKALTDVTGCHLFGTAAYQQPMVALDTCLATALVDADTTAMANILVGALDTAQSADTPALATALAT